MYPDLQTVKQIAAGGTYKRVPVCREILSRYVYTGRGDADFKKSQQTLLPAGERQSGRGMGRYSFLGYDPTMEITCLDGEVTIRENLGNGTETVMTKHVDHPGDTLRESADIKVR